MPRIRSIKPEFWTSEVIASLSIPSRLTFIGLWNYVDDNGVGRDVPQLVVAALYPLDEDPAGALMRVRRALTECSLRALVSRYTVDGKPYFHVTGWSEHQKINRPGRSRFPLPTSEFAMPVTCDDAEFGTPFSEDSVTTHGVLTEPSRPGVRSREQGAGRKEQGELPSPNAELATGRKPTATGEHPTFPAFYAAFPLHKGRKAAATSYARALRTTTPDVLLAAAVRFADDPTRDPAFTPHPATWLNQGRWDDEGPARPQSVAPNPADERTARNLALVARFAQQEQQAPQQLTSGLDLGGMFGDVS